MVCRQEWTPRRGEPRVEQKPPKEEDTKTFEVARIFVKAKESQEMFMSVGQLRAESHVDVQQGAFAQQLSGSCGSSEPKLSKPGGLQRDLFAIRRHLCLPSPPPPFSPLPPSLSGSRKRAPRFRSASCCSLLAPKLCWYAEAPW